MLYISRTMPWRFGYALLALLCLAGLSFSQPLSSRDGGTDSNTVRDKKYSVEFDSEPIEPPGSGSGNGPIDSDDEDLAASGSGSGAGVIPEDPEIVKTTPKKTTTTVMTTTTTLRPQTVCQRQRDSAKQVFGQYVPRCSYNGEFEALQCRGHQDTGDCWCADMQGQEIPGTKMDGPNAPDCEAGNNLAPCVAQLVKNLRSKMLGTFIPKCNKEGMFHRVQCSGFVCYCVDERTGSNIAGTELSRNAGQPNCEKEAETMKCSGTDDMGECWCIDSEGQEIEGTSMDRPNVPDCDEGSTFPICTAEVLKMANSKMLGRFVPRCTPEGIFHPVQCRGSVCFCVDQDTGTKIVGTETARSSGLPDCDNPTLTKIFDEDDNLDIDNVGSQETTSSHGTEEGKINIDEGPDRDEKEKESDEKFDDDNQTGPKVDTIPDHSADKQDGPDHKVKKANAIMTQPGILAGIIGGSVVLLLVLVLLVMFIVYRMRKKDEGSYPLDEPRKPLNYSYVRAPEKEIYA